MAAKKKKSGSSSKKTTTAKAPAPLVATPAATLAPGWATVLRRIASESDPTVTGLPLFESTVASLLASIYLDAEGQDIVALRAFIGGTALQVAGAGFNATRAALDARLQAFNNTHGTSFTIVDSCSKANHVTTSSGCRPGFGHTFSLGLGFPPEPLFGTSSSSPLIVGYGYVVSVDFS